MTTIAEVLFAALDVATTPDPMVLEYLQAGSVAKNAEQEAALAKLRRDCRQQARHSISARGPVAWARARQGRQCAPPVPGSQPQGRRDPSRLAASVCGAFEPMMVPDARQAPPVVHGRFSPDNVAAILDGVFAGKVPDREPGRAI